MQDIYDVIIALVLVAVAVGLSLYQRVRLEKDILIGTVRSFVQLIAVGYVLKIIFDIDNLFLLLLTVLIMVLIGGQTAGRRAKGVSQGFLVSTFSIGVGTFFTLGSMLFLQIITPDPKYVIPLGGMLVGNSMNAAALALERIDSEIKNKKAEIETALALGSTWQQAMVGSFRITVKASMIPILNVMKIVGIVQLPGAMTGMILAGASPLSAVMIQIIVMYMLICASTITAVISTRLAQKKYFTRNHQLVEMIM